MDQLPELLESLRPALLRAAQQINPSDAEDAVQEAMEIALRKFPQFKGNTRNELLGWLRTSVRNVCYMRFRKRRETTGVNSSSIIRVVDGEESPSEVIRGEEERTKLIEMLARLTDAEREAVQLKYFENWSLKKISAQMNRSDSAIGGLLKRGLEKLRGNTSPSQWSRLLGS